MGYRISYHPEKNKRYPAKSVESNLRSWKIFLCSVFIILAVIGVVRKKNEVLDFLIPGDREQIFQSSKQMIENLKNGTSLGDAITTFCREIIVDGMHTV